MGQAGKTAVGVLMVTVFAGLLMAWITLRQQMVDVESFYHLSVTPDGSVLAPLDDHLLHMPATGEQRVLSLTDMGLSGHFGRFAPLDNDTFMALMVRDKSTTDLKRCSLSGQYCETIASADFHPASAHRLYWLPAPERLLAVDNAGHRLVLLARDGRRVDQLDGFRYPNGVHVDGERIVVADTNQHRVVEIAVTRDGFGRELAEHEVWKSLEYRWPAEVHRDPWGWVIQVAGDAMDKDIVAPYSARWSEEGEVDPAAGRDVISSAFSGNALWLAMDDRQLYRTRAPYTALETLPPGAAATFLDNLSDRYASKRLWVETVQVVAVLAFALGLFVAWRLERQH